VKFTIAMATGGLPFHGRSLEEGSLGGSETAFIYMARALAKLGHSVHAFCVCPKPGEYDGVHYHPIEQARKQILTMPYDIIIASRWPEFLREPGNSGLRIMWCHDTLVDVNRFMGSLYQTDEVLFLSKYHQENYKRHIPEVEQFSWITRNGVDRDTIAANIRPKIKGKVIYTSRPERGLHYLLSDIFPLMLNNNPDLVLHYCNYDLKGMQVPPDVEGKINACAELARRFPKKVVNLGSLTKAELYQEISSSELLLYPTDFPEISCITAIEAQACGTPIITTDDFALRETVNSEAGILIPGNPNSEDYIQRFVGSADVLKDQELMENMAEAGQEWVKEHYGWDQIAASWMTHFELLMHRRWASRKSSVITQLLRQGDIAPAEMICERHAQELQDKVDSVCRSATSDLITPEKIAAGYKGATGRFKMMCGLLNLFGLAPKTVLDYHPGFCSIGLMVNQNLPTALIDIDTGSFPESKSHIESVVATMDRSATVTVIDDGQDRPTGHYDLIILNEVLEWQINPQLYLKKLAKNLSPDGVFCLITECGPTTELAKNMSRGRLWNLGYSELKDIFANESFFHGAFVDAGKNEAGEILGHWVFLAKAPKNFENVDLKKKMLITRPYESVSACIIAGNEQDNIGPMLKSIQPICDEILVVTNSNDGTEDIAKTYGAVVTHQEFDNFSTQRNASVINAQGDWILWIDCDERLHKGLNVRKYLSNGIYEALVIKQIHLTLDSLNKNFDMPARLYRNKAHYKFTGLIHEHCEDTSKGPYDHPIAPRMMLPDVDLAHLGYLEEGLRRKKCSNRNMALLRRSVQEQPERQLTWVLVIRDYLNILKWEAEESNFTLALERGGEHHKLLEAVVETFVEHFPNAKAGYHALAYPMYQEALSIMGKAGLPYKECRMPPFEIALFIGGGIGGLQGVPEHPQRIWFTDAKDAMHLINKNATLMLVDMGLLDREEYTGLLEAADNTPIYGAPPAAEALLANGVNVF